jgi:hypothetical protein
VSVNVCPPTLIVPDRDIESAFAAAVYATSPLPVPEPFVIVIHVALVPALHAHPLCVVT